VGKKKKMGIITAAKKDFMPILGHQRKGQESAELSPFRPDTNGAKRVYPDSPTKVRKN